MADPSSASSVRQLESAFSQCVSLCARGESSEDASRALSAAIARVNAELTAADIVARTDPSYALRTTTVADVERLEGDLLRKRALVAEHSARLLDWERRLDSIATESALALRAEHDDVAELLP